MWRTPVPERAFNTALVTAAGEGTVETEPMPLAPRGLVGEIVSMVSRISSGMSVDLGMA